MELYATRFPRLVVLVPALLIFSHGFGVNLSAQDETVRGFHPVVDSDKRSITIGRGIVAHYPATWDASAQSWGNAAEVVVKGERGGVLVPAARTLITTEQRLNHKEALERLLQIAGSRPGNVTWLVIGGWPAFQRRYSEPLALPTDHRVGPDEPNPGPAVNPEDRIALHTSTVIAVADAIVRMETTLAPKASERLAADAEAWATRTTLPARNDGIESASEVEQLRRDKARPTPDAVPVSPKLYRLWGTGSPAAASLTGATSELEAAISSSGTNIIVASNGGLQFSLDSGATFAFSPSALLPFVNQGDPTVAVGKSGNIYSANLGLPGAVSAINLTGLTACTASVMSSGNGGQSFSFASNAVSCAAAQMCFPDQEHIAADAFNASPSRGDQVYAVWRHLTSHDVLGFGLPPNCAGSGSTILGGSFTPSMSCSTNSASTFSAPIVAGSGDYPRVAVGSDGFVYSVMLDGNNVMVHKFSSCANGLLEVAGSPRQVFSGINDITCPLPGLDRCHTGMIVPVLAVDDTNPAHLYVVVERSASGISANDDIQLSDSNDGGMSWSAPLNVNAPVTARRFMPWVCAVAGNAYVGWYDRRAARIFGAASNDLTDFFVASVTTRNGVLRPEGELNLTGVSDPECASGWGLGLSSTRNQNDSESCTVQPQLAGTCTPVPAPPALPVACDFSTPTACSSTQSCKTGDGGPKYGDYSGITCGADTVVSTWASATAPAGFVGAPPAGISAFVDTRKVDRHLTITVSTLPPGNPGKFDVKVDGAAVVSGLTNGSAGPFLQSAGMHTVGEGASGGTVMSAYATSIGGDCDRNGTVHFSAFHPAQCSITNTDMAYKQCTDACSSTDGDCWDGVKFDRSCVTACVNQCSQPTLTMTKRLIPSSDPGRFNLQVDGVTRRSGVGDGGSTPPLSMTLGQHTVGEAAAAGTTLSNYTVSFSGDCDSAGNVAIDYGDTKQCSITNTRKLGTGEDAHLTVNKVLRPSNDPGRFNLQINGGTVAANVGDGGSSGAQALLPGSYRVSETTTAGTQAGNYNTSFGGDCSANGNITLVAGDNKTCTITNHKRDAGCEIACNIEDGQCMAAASDYVERKQCADETKSCIANCQAQ
jgi:hypothetical protein